MEFPRAHAKNFFHSRNARRSFFWRVNTSPYVGFTYEKKKQTKPLGFPTWARGKGLFSGQGEEAMGSLFSRARGGSEATDGDTDLISEVKAATRVASTPGTPRAALPLPPNVPAPALVSVSSPPCARIADPRWTSSGHTDF